MASQTISSSSSSSSLFLKLLLLLLLVAFSNLLLCVLSFDCNMFRFQGLYLHEDRLQRFLFF